MPTFLARERAAGQVVRFGIVGVMNTAVDFALLNLLFHLVGLPLLVANTISYTGGFANSFVWNKHWTFGAGGSSYWKREFFLFGLVSLTGLLINNLGIWSLHEISGATTVLAINLQKLGASVFSIIWNFFGYRYIAFRPRRSDASGRNQGRSGR